MSGDQEDRRFPSTRNLLARDVSHRHDANCVIHSVEDDSQAPECERRYNRTHRQWFFDTAAGKDEILSRRIGRNELAVIDICGALADAQAEYFSQRHDGSSSRQYAVKFISDPGRQNGLYWESTEGQPRSPLGPMAAFATDEGYTVKADSHAFHGYHFRILKKQGSHAPGGAKDYVVGDQMVGGFAFVAYPAEYGNSGVMTFIINQDGVLLQKDLGKTTTETATAMTEFDPDNTWSLVEE